VRRWKRGPRIRAVNLFASADRLPGAPSPALLRTIVTVRVGVGPAGEVRSGDYEEAPRTTDPEGREVVFDLGTREHLMNRRPELLRRIDAILDAVNVPDYHEEDDKRIGHERF
jgi:hypothetical protein